MTTALKQQIQKLARESVREEVRIEVVRLQETRHILEQMASIPVDTATPEEIRAIERGRKDFARGAYVPLSVVLHDMDNTRHKRGEKKSEKISK